MPKKGILWSFLTDLKPWSSTCESRSRPPPLSFLLKLCVTVLHTHRYHPPKFQPNVKHHDRVLIFPHFARAAAACCLLAAAKPKAHFQGFLGILEGQNGPPWAQNGLKTLVEHPKWSRNKFGNNNFGPFLDPQMTPVTLP